MRVTQAEIACSLTSRLDLPAENAASVLKAIFAAITEALAAGQEVRLNGFGKFFTRRRRAAKTDIAPPPAPGRCVAFKSFDFLSRQIAEAGLDSVAWPPAPVERRSCARDEAFQDGTAIVRISGIPVCEFKLKSISAGGSSFWVHNDAFILRNIRVGQEIDIRLRHENSAVGPAMQRARIVHITPATAPNTRDYFILGVRILTQLPM
ncbi:MAG: HU family DNA-binding protein [Desulfatitalea sp.]